MRFVTCVALSMWALVGLATGAAAQQPPPTRGIVNVTGQLYRAQNNNHYTVFLVTPEGIIMSDPINRDFSRWLKGEIATPVQSACSVRALHAQGLGSRLGRRRLGRHRRVCRPSQHARRARASRRQPAPDR